MEGLLHNRPSLMSSWHNYYVFRGCCRRDEHLCWIVEVVFFILKEERAEDLLWFPRTLPDTVEINTPSKKQIANATESTIRAGVSCGRLELPSLFWCNSSSFCSFAMAVLLVCQGHCYGVIRNVWAKRVHYALDSECFLLHLFGCALMFRFF